jgi:hypothetical protein
MGMAGIPKIGEAQRWQSFIYHKMSKFIQLKYGRDSVTWRYTNMAGLHLNKYRKGFLTQSMAGIQWIEKNKDMIVFHLSTERFPHPEYGRDSIN